jgi:hypothetical protein
MSRTGVFWDKFAGQWATRIGYAQGISQSMANGVVLATDQIDRAKDPLRHFKGEQANGLVLGLVHFHAAVCIAPGQNLILSPA